MSLCLIGLGSNVGDREAALRGAMAALGRRPQIRVLAHSRFHPTAPVGGPAGQGPFLNAAAVLDTPLGPEALLAALLELERSFGRSASGRWGPRSLDLDLLLHGNTVLQTPFLVVPHPRMAWRRFVLEPAAEIAPQMLHPTTGWTIARLLDHLNTAQPYVAITGPVAAGKTELASQLAQTAPAHWIAETIDLPQLEAFYANPAGMAQQTELQFLDRRASLLARDCPTWLLPTPLWVSDFWFDQCLAFASLCLGQEAFAEFQQRWQEAAGGVVRPKLTVMLDASTDRLLERIAQRGRRGEDHWTGQHLDRLRGALDACLRRPDVGPVLTLVNQPKDRVLEEVLAAVVAMR